MRIASLAFAVAAFPAAVLAGDSWDAVRQAVWGDRPIADGGASVRLDAPVRAADDRAAAMTATAAFADGRLVRAITVVIDENPMPVSAAVALATPQAAMTFAATYRLNGPSQVRVVVEDADGGLWMADQLVKTSGVGACAAPPSTDAKLAMATMGQMTLAAEPAAVDTARLKVSHPSHSGMQMDQVTLLYTPARYVETLEVWADDAPLFTLTGSISLSENPEIAFTHPHAAQSLRVRLTDTSGAIFERSFGLGAS
jgi:sulfur-oxidizing protein SoxY